MTSHHGARRDEVIQRQCIEGPESAPWTLYCLVNCLGQRIDPIGIVVSGPRILDIVPRLELFEAFSASVIDVLGIGNELGRRGRSIGDRHFDVEDGLMVQGATANAVVVSS